MQTTHLQDALRILLSLIQKLNLRLLYPVTSDLAHNIEKLSSSAPVHIKNIRPKTAQQQGSEWGIYTVQFFTKFICGVVERQLDPSISATLAYNEVLRAHHSVILKGVFGSILRMLPERQVLCEQIGLVIDVELVKEFVRFRRASEEVCGVILRIVV
ncbi:Putative_glycolipid transfer protein [Hexamita inflata]|uniref:Glycolipid transfer protein n=1 Tax=Hexamita inflata TaxID=28002 RepID=A0AA86PBB3_9EUKA|nr:Putative glycolipid transfer protein [Hexamita inflata]